MKSSELLNVLDKVVPGLSGTEEEPSYLIFSKRNVLAANEEVSVRCPLELPEDGVQGCVPANPMLAFLKRAPDKDIKLKATKGELRITCGRSRVGMPMVGELFDNPIADLAIPKKGWIGLPDGFAEAVRLCLFSASKEHAMAVLTNLHFKDNTVESTDRYRMTRVHLEDYPLGDMLIPATSSKYLLKFGAVVFQVKGSWAHFKNDDGAVMSCRLSAGEYIDLDPFLESQKGKRLTFPDKFKEVLDRAGVFSLPDSGFDTDKEIKVVVDAGKMEVSAEGAGGWFKETIKCPSVKNLEFAIHPDFLKEVLSHTDSAKITKNSLIFKGENFVHSIAT